jgi:hypothetical protein
MDGLSDRARQRKAKKYSGKERVKGEGMLE